MLTDQKNKNETLSKEESKSIEEWGDIVENDNATPEQLKDEIAVIMLFIKSGWLPYLQKSLAAVGQMAFTNYYLLCHVVLDILPEKGYRILMQSLAGFIRLFHWLEYC